MEKVDLKSKRSRTFRRVLAGKKPLRHKDGYSSCNNVFECDIKNNIQHKEKNRTEWGIFPYVISDRIIVSFTSWKKRIQNTPHIVELMMNQTIKPYKIILNLSTDEFPLKEKELPNKLIELQGSLFEIYWVKENTKAYKKIIPTMDRFPKDVIISIDDDIEYPVNFIEEMYKRFIDNGKCAPVTGGSSSCQWEYGLYTHHGAFSLVKREFFGDYLNDLLDNVVKKIGYENFFLSDMVYTYSTLLNGLRYSFHLDTLNMKKLRLCDSKGKIEPLSDYTFKHERQLKYQHKIVRDYILKKYGKTFKDLLKSQIIVNITTWQKRDWCLYPMLKNLQKQSVKPDKTILWLSHEEYDETNLPLTIKKCVDENLLSCIKWVDKNIYCHKRFQCFNEFNSCYNLFLDDDILYQNKYIEELTNMSLEHQDCVTVYSTNSCDYDGYKIIKKKVKENPSHKNMFMGGCCCFPPYIMPKDALVKDCDKRDIYVKKCDESWIRPFLIMHDIKIFSIHDWDKKYYPIISDTQKDSLYSENKRVIMKGMREKERNFFNAIKITHTEKKCKKIWPKIGIDTYKLQK